MRQRQGKQNTLGRQFQTGIRAIFTLCGGTAVWLRQKIRVFLSGLTAGSV
jgi:hypothetical protein